MTKNTADEKAKPTPGAGGCKNSKPIIKAKWTTLKGEQINAEFEVKEGKVDLSKYFPLPKELKRLGMPEKWMISARELKQYLIMLSCRNIEIVEVEE